MGIEPPRAKAREKLGLGLKIVWKMERVMGIEPT